MLVFMLIAALPGRALPDGGAADLSSQLEARFAIQRGADFLVASQGKDGRWGAHPGITAMVVLSLSRLPEPGEEVRGAMARAMPTVREFAAGVGQTTGGAGDTTYIYSVAASTLVLSSLGEGETDRAAVVKLQGCLTDFLQRRLASGQVLASGGVADLPDISNLHWAIDAILLTSPDGLSPALKTAVQRFIESCQLASGPEAGGFVYAPVREGKEVRAWGSLSRAGIRALLLSGVPVTAAPVTRATAWLGGHTSFTENPGLQQGGCYYYFYLVAGTNVLLELRQAQPVPVHWRTQLIDTLLSRQQGDGGWQNDNRLWLEDSRALCTAYAIFSLSLTLQ